MKDVAKFFNEVRVELSKVIWPSWDEWIGSTIIVLVLVTFFAAYLGSIDLGLTKIVKYVLDYFGAY